MGITNPLNMEIFKNDEHILFGWNNLRPQDDQSWPFKQCKKFITRFHIAGLWYFDDMDAM